MKKDVYLEILIQKNSYDTVFTFLSEFNFDVIFEDDLSKMILKTLHKAVINTRGAKEWIIRDGSMWSNDQMLNQLMYHPDVESCGHTGMSVSWALAQLKSIYTNGWNHWVKLTLISRGVGITTLCFDKGVVMKTESVCVYWFEKWINGRNIQSSLSEQTNAVSYDIPDIKLLSDQSYNIVSLCHMANENKFEKLLDMILDKFGNQLSSKYYFDAMKTLDDLKEGSFVNIYRKYWEKNYHNDAYVDCSKICKKKLIQGLWDRLPDQPHRNSEVPTGSHIKKKLNKSGSIYILGGKNMHFIGKNWTKIFTFWMDIDMNEFGAFKTICANLAIKRDQ